jgi:hypothetical protein
MKQFSIILLILFFESFAFHGQSICSNLITGINPNLSNPYTNGQIVDPNCTVSGISRGSGIFGKNANNRYNATSWDSTDLDSNKYFEYTITPKAGKKIDFLSFSFVGQVSSKGPTHFAFRSSIDGFSTDIGTIVATGSTVFLSNPAFQNIAAAITFRIYAWGAIAGTGTFSINSFNFDGTIDCVIPEAPVLSDIAISCFSTSFDVNWIQPLQADAYFFDVATDASFANTVAGYSNMLLGYIGTQNVTGVTAGKTYYVRLRAKNDCGISGYSNTSVVSSPVTIFDGNSWDNGLPDTTKKAIFTGSGTITTPLNACSVQINPGVNIVVGVLGGPNDTAILHIENGLTVDPTSTLTFENNASLVQVNDAAVNTGTIIYKRIAAPMKNFVFTYWSSPVKDQVLEVLSPNTFPDKYFSFANNNWVLEKKSNKMNPAGKGFIIRVPKPNSTYPNGKDYWIGASYAQPVQFEGIPYNGVITIATQGPSQTNLIGNPYPSALDADLFLKDVNNKDVIDGGLYFWTHNSSAVLIGSTYVYVSDDYATYTLSGGTATGGGPAPTGQIAAGQSFFVGSKAAGNFAFNNSMRISDTGSNAQFYKMSKTKKGSGIEKNRVWLNMTNAGGAFKQLLVGYIAGATNDVDNLYDAASFDGNSYIDFYSINKAANYTIQGRALPFKKTDEVPLGYKTEIEGTFTISINQTDGVLANQAVYLEDKSLKVIHNLKNGPYTFNTLKGTFDDRFVLVYVDKSEVVVAPVIDIPPLVVLDPTLENVSFDKKEKSVIVSVKNHQIKVDTFEENIDAILVYDLKGRILYKKNNIGKKQFFATDFLPTNQILIVKTISSNAATRTDKIFF